MNDSTSSIAAETPDSTSTLMSDVALFSVALIWGINIPIMKTGLEQIDVFVFNAIRLVVSAGVLAVFALRERRQGLKPRPGIGVQQLLIYAATIAGVYQLFFLLGVSRTTSGNTALIFATVPMWTALMAWVMLSETLPRQAWGGILLALVGTVIVALQKGDVAAGSEHLWGNLLILGAALLWSAGTVYSRPLMKRISPMQLSASAAVIALPMHLLVAATREQNSMAALQSVDLWLIILYAGVLSSGLALPMWNYGVRHAGAAHAAIIQNVIPLIAIVAAWITRGETATAEQLLGGTLIIGGLFTMRRSRRQTNADDSPPGNDS